MDTLKNIKEQISKVLTIDKKLVGLEDVLTHIERAEHLLNLGQNKDDKHFYTDVIYRTNHAYEGILKEAYNVFAEKAKKKITPNEIEKYLLAEKVLNERVATLLENYRRDWRNTSTHDYRLFFNSGEAFLSILSVTSFIHLLLTQILDKLIFEYEKARILPNKDIIVSKFKDYSSLNFIDKIKLLLKSYDGNLHNINDESRISLFTEREFIQGISAHIQSIDSTMTGLTEPLIGNDKSLRPDLIIKNSDGELIIIEIKVYKRLREPIFGQNDKNQMIAYLTKSDIKTGFIFMFPRSINTETELEDIDEIVSVGNESYNLIRIQEKKPITTCQ
jgi:uncharacterized protein YutE (UPF0331/DUF86 family)